MLNRYVVMRAAWALFGSWRIRFSRWSFGAALANAWYDLEKAASDAAIGARHAEEERRRLAALAAMPEERVPTIVSGEAVASYLPAHMSAARTFEQIRQRAGASAIDEGRVYGPELPVWRRCPALMQRLLAAQNHPANLSRNIMTFVIYFDTRDELARHVEHYERRAAEYRAPVRRRAYA